MRPPLPLAAFATLLCASAAAAEAPLASPTAILAEAGPGTRWGLRVIDDQGREVAAIDPDGRFMPASNTKVFTTAAALWTLAQGRLADEAADGTRVRLESTPRGKTVDVVLEGRGDARLSAAPGCIADCLASLADAVAARTRRVHDVIGDDTLFPDERWSPGMSWNNIPTTSGTGISALTLDDNEIAVTVTPGTPGQPPRIAPPSYYTFKNHAETVAGKAHDLGYYRAPNGRVILVTGTIGIDAGPTDLRMGVDDPADFAAWRFADMLRARGVRVDGEARARHRPVLPADDPAQRGDRPVERRPAPIALAALDAPPLAEDVAIINKKSQNLHAELLLRRLGAMSGSGSIADGQAIVRAMLDQAGVPPHAVSLADGSGMSSYNRVSPRGMTTLLAWIAHQPWGQAWRATLPVGGTDGTLSKRFAGTPLAGKIFAKTGTLNATNALAGYLTAASGKVLTFAIYANDVPDDVAANPLMDRALLALAAAN